MKPAGYLSVAFFSMCLFAVISPTTASAASLYIDPANVVLNRGDSVTAAVRLDTNEGAGECVNAVDATIVYPDNIEPVDITIGDSIFSMWVESPVIHKEKRTITFAGGIPNGYCGRIIGDPRLTNTLVKIVFRSPGFTIGGSNTDQSKAVIKFGPETTAYLNDGQGTKASLQTFGSTIELTSRAGAVLENDWQEEVSRDQVPPEEFSISLEKDAKAFSQKYYIIFNTTDKQTGIDHYEVMEEPLAQFGAFQWGRADAPWVVARSPYVLKDQSLNSIVRVKAVDKAGNEYIANYIPDESVRTLSHNQILNLSLIAGAVMVVLVLAGLGALWLKRRRRKKLSGTVLDEHTDDLSDEYEQDE